MKLQIEWDEVTQQLVLTLPGGKVEKFQDQGTSLERAVIRATRKITEKFEERPRMTAQEFAAIQRAQQEFTAKGGKVTRLDERGKEKKWDGGLEELGLI